MMSKLLGKRLVTTTPEAQLGPRLVTVTVSVCGYSLSTGDGVAFRINAKSVAAGACPVADKSNKIGAGAPGTARSVTSNSR